MNIPVGIIGLLVAAAFLREERQPEPGRLDAPGFLLSATGLAAVMYALAEAGSRGLDDARVAVFGTVGLALLVVFTVVELRTAEPLIDVRLFRDKLFRAANTVQFMGQGGLLGALFLLPLLLQAEMGLSPLQSGLTTFPQAIGVFIVAQPAGRIYRIVGPRRMMMVGMAGATLTTLAFLLVDLETSQWWIRLIMLARGGSFALTLIPMQTATFATIRSVDAGRASAIFNAGRQVAASFGVALLATVLTNRLGHHHAVMGSPLTRGGALTAFHEAFLVAAALAVVGIIASLLIDDKAAAGTMRQRVVLEDDEPLGVPAA